MEIYKFALDFEKESKAFYENCSENAKDENLKKIFDFLAKEEAKHVKIVSNLAKGEMEVYESDILTKAKKIFNDIAKNVSTEDQVYESDIIKIYRKAELMEEKSRKFYSEKAANMEDSKEKDILLSLAKEEKRHEIIIDNILEHIERPEEWVEHAEFNKLEEY